MAAIDIGLYIPVTNTVDNPLNNAKSFAGLGLTINPLIPTTTPILQFKSLADVGDFFGTGSNEYASARKYFASCVTAITFPPYIYFGLLILTARDSSLTGGTITSPSATLTALQAISTGALTVVVDGVSYATTGIDLTGATSLSDAANRIQTAIISAHAGIASNFNLDYDGVNNQFFSTNTHTGSTSTMGYFSSASGTLATILKTTAATGAVLSQGANAMTITENLNALKGEFTDQFGIYFVDNLGSSLDDAKNLELAQWVSDQGDRFWSLVWSNEVALESLTDTTSIWYQITQAGIKNSSVFDEVIYNNSDRVSAAAGIIASVDLTQPNSAITLAWKQQDGLLPSVTNTHIADILDQKGINYYGKVAFTGSPLTQNFFYPGAITGKWVFVDNLVGAVWIAYQCQFEVADVFLSVGQVPIDPDGQGQVRSALHTAMEGSKANGIIVTGLTFDNATSIEIRTTFGIDSIELTNNGYAILNTLPAEGLRKLRVSSPWYVLYTKGSAYQFLPINTRTYF
jgi:hypothetical protein